MSVRAIAKKLVYGHCPGFAGAFPYFGTRVFFPRRAFIFDLVCQEGIYEHALLTHMQVAVTPGSWYFDIGANLGLMSVPILKTNDNVKVLSFEPSSNSWPYLQKTWRKSPWTDRWKIVRKAVGDHVGQVQFFRSVERYAGYDGLRNTERAPASGCETIAMTTLDEEWNALGRPLVSCLKLDAEGAEMCILAGAREMIRETQPYVFLEWYEENFRHFGNVPNDLLDTARGLGYEVAAIPQLGEIHSLPLLVLQMRVTASFVLVPGGSSRASSRASRECTAIKH